MGPLSPLLRSLGQAEENDKEEDAAAQKLKYYTGRKVWTA